MKILWLWVHANQSREILVEKHRVYTRGRERDPAREDEWIIALACDIIKFIICAKAGCPAKLRICFPALSLFLPFGRYEKHTIKDKLSQIDRFVYPLQSKQLVQI